MCQHIFQNIETRVGKGGSIALNHGFLRVYVHILGQEAFFHFSFFQFMGSELPPKSGKTQKKSTSHRTN